MNCLRVCIDVIMLSFDNAFILGGDSIGVFRLTYRVDQDSREAARPASKEAVEKTGGLQQNSSKRNSIETTGCKWTFTH